MNALPNAERSKNKKLFVLDTNVLMHDPTALYRFDPHPTMSEAMHESVLNAYSRTIHS